MRCLICNKNLDVDALKIHYQYHHSVNENNYFFRELFPPNNNAKRCDECQLQFKNNRQKKNHNFLSHRHQQTGGAFNQQLPVNFLKRGPASYYCINFYQHENFYDFYDEKIVDRFSNSVRGLSVSRGKELKMQGYFEFKNYQRIEPVELENARVWLTNVFVGRYFNEFIRNEMKKDILKRFIINGSTGSSWLFKLFNKLSVIVTDNSAFNDILAT